jgi:hypothetical protein
LPDIYLRPFQENKSPKNGVFSKGKASGLGGFNFWNYLSGPKSSTDVRVCGDHSPLLRRYEVGDGGSLIAPGEFLKSLVVHWKNRSCFGRAFFGSSKDSFDKNPHNV